MPGMATYTINLYDSSGIQAAARPVMAAADEDALTTARMMIRNRETAEVRQGERLVGKVRTWSAEHTD